MLGDHVAFCGVGDIVDFPPEYRLKIKTEVDTYEAGLAWLVQEGYACKPTTAPNNGYLGYIGMVDYGIASKQYRSCLEPSEIKIQGAWRYVNEWLHNQRVYKHRVDIYRAKGNH
jgi:hypothetical protein